MWFNLKKICCDSFIVFYKNQRNVHVLANKLKLNGILISDEVRNALIDNVPIVALESTIITHGMPYPNNVNCALNVEDEIRRQVK